MTAILGLRAALKGLKFYITAFLYIGCIVAEKLLGFDVPGFEAGPDWLNQVIIAIGAMTGRAAVAKISTGNSTIDAIVDAAR